MLLGSCGPEAGAELATYQRINSIRQESGVPALRPDATLVRIARARSEDMASNGYFGHVPRDGCDYTCMMARDGISYAYAGETIAWNTYGWARTPGAAVDTWAASPEHLATMVNCHYERFGTGVAVAASGRVYFTTIYEGSARC
jgi:uncharacterized protein YkwD